MFLADPRESDLTFAEPGNNAPFSFSMPKVPGLDPVAMDKQTRQFEAGVLAAERKTRLVDTVNARQQALEEAAENRIRSVRDLTGVALENPYRGGYELDARERLGVPLTGASPIELSRLQRAQHDIFHEKVDELAQSRPDKAAGLSFGQSIEDQAKAISQSAAQEPAGGFIADVAGGIWGSRRDPLFLASLIAGPGLSAAKTVIARIGFGALKQGLANAGFQAMAQPAVQDWRREIGERSGVVPALENVGMALLFGGIMGGGVEVGRAVMSSASRGALTKVARGEATAADVDEAARGVGVKLDDTDARAIKVGEADEAAERAAIGEPPAGVAPQEHAELVAQAVRHAEDPANNPPPDLPLVLPQRPASQVRVLDEALPAAIGDRDVVDGKPVSFGRFDPAELGTDAATFQYKGGGDAAGVTDRLKHVTRWDALASGKALIFERADGSRVVADGHQRLGLAKRLGADDTGVKIDGFLFREADGWTPQDVRAMAAKKNMQEGSGDAIDAARVLRDRPDLLDGAMPISSPMMKNAVALTRLSDEAFGMTINGVVPANYAAAVGSMVTDPLQHAGVLSDLVRFAPETEREARLLIGEIMASGFRAEEQINLFGAGEAQRSLMGERVKVLDAAIVSLSRDKKLFGTVAQKADVIEAAGNQLARGANDARARDAAQLQDMLTRLARRTGPVSDALNRAAAAVNDGMKAGKAADGFLDEVRGLLDRDGLAGLLADPELKPRAVVEPGTPEATAAAEIAFEERLDAPARGLSITRLSSDELPADLQGDADNILAYRIMRGGEQVGEAQFSNYDLPPNEITLEWIGRRDQEDWDKYSKSGDANSIGPAAVRGILKQFIADNPQIDTIHAMRVTGARDEAGVKGYQSYKIGPTGRLELLRSTYTPDRAEPPRLQSDVIDELRRARGRLDWASAEPAGAFAADATLDAAPGPTGIPAAAAADIQAMIEAGADPKTIAAHPAVRDAVAYDASRTPTTALPGYGTPEFRAARQFDFDGETVTGYDAAVARLTDGARAFAEGPVKQERRAVIVLRPPAAGKSTLSEDLARVRGAAIVDPDEAKKVIPEFEGGAASSAVHEESGDMADEVLRNLVMAGDNLVIPKVGGNAASIRAYVQQLTELGYRVDLAHLRVTPDEAYRRMIGRFLKTGRIIGENYFDSIGVRPGETYYTLKREGIANDYANIDGQGPFGAPRQILDGDGQLAGELRPQERSGRSGDAEVRQDAAGSAQKAEAEQVAQPSLIDSVAVSQRPDGRDARFVSRDAALADADRIGEHADIVQFCER